MREDSKVITVSTSGDYLIGYERILDYFKEAQKECPKGVGLKRESKPSANYISLQFKIGSKRVAKACGCNLSMSGISEALKKAKSVAEALGKFSSETEFWNWYDDQILEKNVIKNDVMTFAEAIALVENAYWEGYTKKRQKRDKENVSHQNTFYQVYSKYYKLLPQDKKVNLTEIMTVINSKEKGSKTYKNCLCAMRKLAETISNSKLQEELSQIDGKQTIYRDDLQMVSIEDFLQLRREVLDIPSGDKRYNLESRKAWLWVFSMQVVYGLRVHEVFAIQNADQPFLTKDNISIPALNDPKNTKMVAVVGDKTLLETTTKTGYRLTVPMIPPTHPNLIEQLEIKSGSFPQINLVSTKNTTIAVKYAKTAHRNLKAWSKYITQTHAFRHLSNLNGMMSGVSLETRAMSLGHSPMMNDTVYKKRQTTKTTMDLLTKSNNQAIPLLSAIEVLRQVGSDVKTITLLSAIYSVTPEEIVEFLET
ncbi:hypothetical protein [Microcoleus sp. Pol12A5]|uniref:hypothetical protein n=1 Tax=Microcoleus sp. Pol12A5 TaxID=3055392 RepID=UPI002FCFFFAE